MIAFNKKKKGKNEIIIIGADDIILYKGIFIELPLEESLILEKCVEYFNDHNPCFIHRSAAVNRIIFEAEEYLKRISSGMDVILEKKKIPQEICSVLSGFKELRRLEVRWANQ